MAGLTASLIAGAGALGGAMAGSQKNQVTQTTQLPGATEEERDLQRRSLEQYLAQLEQANRQEQQMQQLDPLRQQALQGYQDILSGQALQASPLDLQNIENIRRAQVQLGTQDIQSQLGDLLGQTANSAGLRNLRGQAFAELQGQNMEQAARQVGNVVNTAGLQAAQATQAAPYQRLQAQSPFLQQGLSYQDQLRQQAFANRQALQSPALMDSLLRERLASASTTQTQPGGGFAGALSGALGGLGQGAKVGGQLGSLFSSPQQPQQPQQMAGTQGDLGMDLRLRGLS